MEFLNKKNQSWLLQKIYEFSDRKAIVDQNGQYTYKELYDQVLTYLNSFEKKEIKENQTLIIHSDYNFYAISLFLALYEKRSIIVPLVSNIKEEINQKISVSSCDALIKLKDDGGIDLESFPKKNKHHLANDLVKEDKAGLILFSSGSTGEPKAMIHNLNILVDGFQDRRQRSLNIIIFLMFDHIGGLNTLLNFLASGSNIILPSNRNPLDIAELIEKHEVHILPASPTFLNMMLMADATKKYDFSSLKMITYGTEIMPESLLKRLRIEFPKTKFLQTFGTSETGISQTTSRSSESLEMKLNDENQEYKIVEGELWLRSKTQILGYLNSEMTSFTEDGWFKTGDLVEELEDGYIRVIGREKEVINVGGEKVLPSEIESYLMQMEIVLDALVHGEKNAITGQGVVADVVIIDGIENKKARSMIRMFCRENMTAYKIPTKINFIKQTNISDRVKKIRLNKETH